MSSSAAGSSAANANSIPWRSQFLEHISKVDGPTFTLSTLHPIHDTRAESSSSSPSFFPRARTCAFRGMWTELPENERNPAPRNEKVYESDCFAITTDVRMEKVSEIFASTPKQYRFDDKEAWKGSGGGGPVEAVFWVPPTMTQWRLQGRAYIIAPDIDGDNTGVKIARKELGSRMRVVKGMEGKEKDWSWSKELTAYFGNQSPTMRGSFRNPPPGTSISIPPSEGLGLGQQIEDLHDEIARSNFRVVVIKPEVVDQVDLTDPRRGRRWRYTFVGKDGEDEEWKIEELWP
ncbi:hypothetical protein F5884DRAFT_794422 [Xylogone sp. PMI_703]|nr:hypothetical protein F5884DRAFT_794422 [Xylogone sp. PMI_703]